MKEKIYKRRTYLLYLIRFIPLLLYHYTDYIPVIESMDNLEEKTLILIFCTTNDSRYLLSSDHEKQERNSTKLSLTL